MSVLDINDISEETVYKNLVIRFMQDEPIKRMHGASVEELKVLFADKNGRYKMYDGTIPATQYKLYLAYSGALVYVLISCDGMNDTIPLKNQKGIIEYAGAFPHIECILNNEIKLITLSDILKYESTRSFR